PDACPFADRCPIAIEACVQREPDLEPVASANGEQHLAACIRADQIDSEGRIGGLPVYPLPVIPESELTRKPREERPVTLEVRNMVKTFPLLKGALFKRKVGEVHAVKGLSFDVREGETMAIV